MSNKNRRKGFCLSKRVKSQKHRRLREKEAKMKILEEKWQKELEASREASISQHSSTNIMVDVLDHDQGTDTISTTNALFEMSDATQSTSSRYASSPKIKQEASSASEEELIAKSHTLRPSTAKIHGKLCGRRIVNIDYFLKALKDVSVHSADCSLKTVIVMKERSDGLRSCFFLKCTRCKFKAVVWTEDPDDPDRNLNGDAVAGMADLGCGVDETLAFLLKLQIPPPSRRFFSKGGVSKKSHDFSQAWCGAVEEAPDTPDVQNPVSWGEDAESGMLILEDDIKIEPESDVDEPTFPCGVATSGSADLLTNRTTVGQENTEWNEITIKQEVISDVEDEASVAESSTISHHNMEATVDKGGDFAYGEISSDGIQGTSSAVFGNNLYATKRKLDNTDIVSEELIGPPAKIVALETSTEAREKGDSSQWKATSSTVSYPSRTSATTRESYEFLPWEEALSESAAIGTNGTTFDQGISELNRGIIKQEADTSIQNEDLTTELGTISDRRREITTDGKNNSDGVTKKPRDATFGNNKNVLESIPGSTPLVSKEVTRPDKERHMKISNKAWRKNKVSFKKSKITYSRTSSLQNKVAKAVSRIHTSTYGRDKINQHKSNPLHFNPITCILRSKPRSSGVFLRSTVKKPKSELISRILERRARINSLLNAEKVEADERRYKASVTKYDRIKAYQEKRKSDAKLAAPTSSTHPSASTTSAQLQSSTSIQLNAPKTSAHTDAESHVKTVTPETPVLPSRGSAVFHYQVIPNAITATPATPIAPNKKDGIYQLHFVPNAVPGTSAIADAKSYGIAFVPRTSMAAIPKTTVAAVPTTISSVSRTSITAVPRTTIAAVPRITISSVSGSSIAAIPKLTTAAVPRITMPSVSRTSIAMIPKLTTGAVPRITMPSVSRTSIATIPKLTTAAVPRITMPSLSRTSIAAIPKLTTAAVPRITIPSVPRTSLAAIPKSTIAAVPRITIPAVPRTSTPKSTIASVPRITLPSVRRTPIAAIPNSTITAVPRITIPSVPRTSVAAVSRTITAVPNTSISSVPRISMAAVPRTSIAVARRTSIAAARRTIITAVPRTSLAADRNSEFFQRQVAPNAAAISPVQQAVRTSGSDPAFILLPRSMPDTTAKELAVVQNFQELVKAAKLELNINESGDVIVMFDSDGTEIDSEEVFQHLMREGFFPDTELQIVENGQNWIPPTSAARTSKGIFAMIPLTEDLISPVAVIETSSEASTVIAHEENLIIPITGCETSTEITNVIPHTEIFLPPMSAVETSNEAITMIPHTNISISPIAAVDISSEAITAIPHTEILLPPMAAVETNNEAITMIPHPNISISPIAAVDISSETITAIPQTEILLPPMTAVATSNEAITMIPDANNLISPIGAVETSSEAITAIPHTTSSEYTHENIPITSSSASAEEDSGINETYSDLNGFKIPWEKFPKTFIMDCNSKKKPNAVDRRRVVREIITEVRNLTENPPRKLIKKIAAAVVNRYPESLGDCIGQIKHEHLFIQLENRLHHMNRLQKVRIIETDKKSKHKYGCQNWQPRSYPEGETYTSLSEKKNWLKSQFKMNIENEEILNNMQLTFVIQRMEINTTSFSIGSYLEEWPYLFKKKYFLDHANTLMNFEIERKWKDEMSVKLPKILNFFRIISSNRKHREITQILDSGKTETKPSVAEECSMVLLLLKYFNEDENQLIKYFESTETVENVLDTLKAIEYPVIAVFGHNILENPLAIVSVQGVLIGDISKFSDQLAIAFIAFYTFNYPYPQAIEATLEFLQRYILNIEPIGGGNKRGGKRKRSSVHPLVRSLTTKIFNSD